MKLFYFIYPLISSSSQVKIAVPPSPDWREPLQAIPHQYLPEPLPCFVLYSDASADPDLFSHKMLLQTALHFSSGHHPGKIPGKNAEEKPCNKQADAAKIQSFSGESGNQECGKGHYHSHGQRVAAGYPLPYGGTHLKIFYNLRQRRSHSGG